MKLRGHRCKLVLEGAKDLTYEERFKTLKNQVYVFAKQCYEFLVKQQITLSIINGNSKAALQL